VCVFHCSRGLDNNDARSTLPDISILGTQQCPSEVPILHTIKMLESYLFYSSDVDKKYNATSKHIFKDEISCCVH
jgi:hypothetical protein